MLPKSPDPALVTAKLKGYIARDERPANLIHNFLDSGSKEANLLANTLIDNREALKVLTSPQSRAWLHRWLNDTLDYLQKYAKEAGYE